jgi:hypothetical protein
MVKVDPPLGGTALEPVWRPEALTDDWLTTCLRNAGLLRSGAVSGFSVEPVGTGQMGDSFRLLLQLTPGAEAAVPTLVGKFTAADEQSRTTGVSMRTAEVEVRFYQQVAPTLPARIPACYYAEVDAATARFVLILEDLAPRQPGDQVAGCTVEEAALALDELAKIHAPHWGDPALARLEWLNRRDPESLGSLAAVFPSLWTGFVERYAGRAPDHVVRVGDRFFPRIGDYFLRQDEPRTVQHADYRVDNLLFGGPADSPVAVVDWQTVTWGQAAADLAYFLGGSIDVEARRRHETDLVRRYFDVARGHGMTDYSFDDLWRDYRRHAYSGLVMAVGAAMMVARTERGDDMFLAMADRAAAHVEDMDAERLLGDP